MKHLPSSPLVLHTHPLGLLPAGIANSVASAMLVILLECLKVPYAALIGIGLFMLVLYAQIDAWRRFSLTISPKSIQIYSCRFGRSVRILYPLESLGMITCEQNIVQSMIDSGNLVILTRSGYRRYPLLTPFSAVQTILDR